MENMSDLRLSVGTMPFYIEAVALRCGDDWNVTIGGGTRYHIGATAVAFALPSFKDPERMTGTVSVITLPGHKEDEVARSGALKLAKALETTVTVSVGIHIDNATWEEVQKLVSLFDQLIDELAQAMGDK
jgi:gallate decarboxylase subunit D